MEIHCTHCNCIDKEFKELKTLTHSCQYWMEGNRNSATTCPGRSPGKNFCYPPPPHFLTTFWTEFTHNYISSGTLCFF